LINLTWLGFIENFGHSDRDLHYDSIALTRAELARTVFLTGLTDLAHSELNSGLQRVRSIYRTSEVFGDTSDALGVLTTARRIWSATSGSGFVERVGNYVAALREHPDFAEGVFEYAVMQSGDQSHAFLTKGERSAAWAANLAIVLDYGRLTGLTPLPCYGFVSRQMLRPDVRPNALPALIDQRASDLAFNWSGLLSSLVRRSARYANSAHLHGDGNAMRCLTLLSALGPLASFQLTRLLGCDRSTSSRALRRLVSLDLCSHEPSSRLYSVK
jgi:hypothetical protein